MGFYDIIIWRPKYKKSVALSAWPYSGNPSLFLADTPSASPACKMQPENITTVPSADKDSHRIDPFIKNNFKNKTRSCHFILHRVNQTIIEEKQE